MFASPRHRFLFVHVQKTGGLTVERSLKKLIPDGVVTRDTSVQRHSQLSTILTKHPEMRSYFTFGLVRNPWGRMVSWWRMIERVRGSYERVGDSRGQGRSKVIGKNPNPFWRDVVLNCPTFDEFVLEAPDRWQRLRRPQIDYLVAQDRVADLIGRTETLEADLRTVVDKLGLPWTPPPEPVNADPNPRGSYRDYYDTATRDRIAERFAKDIDHFGYEF